MKTGSAQAELLAGLSGDPERAARFLLGKTLVRRDRGREVLCRIVETEAYLGLIDPASHAYRGKTPRTAPLWERPGTIYVYVIYGIYHCLNVACDREGVPGCVLIRAAEPLSPGHGQRDMSGPGRLCRALRIDRTLTGRHFFERGSALLLRDGVAPGRVGTSLRVGFRDRAERHLRFFDAASPAVSRYQGARSSRRPRAEQA